MEISIVEAEPQPTAVAVAEDVDWRRFPQLWGPMLDSVYAQVRPAGGRWTNVMAYRDGGAEVGVLVEGRELDLTDPVVLSATPAGRAATALFEGDWNRLPAAHREVDEWCERHGHAQAGTVWEIYGHAETPSTTLFHLLT